MSPVTIRPIRTIAGKLPLVLRNIGQEESFEISKPLNKSIIRLKNGITCKFDEITPEAVKMLSEKYGLSIFGRGIDNELEESFVYSIEKGAGKAFLMSSKDNFCSKTISSDYDNSHFVSYKDNKVRCVTNIAGNELRYTKNGTGKTSNLTLDLRTSEKSASSETLSKTSGNDFFKNCQRFLSTLFGFNIYERN